MLSRYLFIFMLTLFCSVSVAQSDLRFVFTYEGRAFENLIKEFSQEKSIPIEMVWSTQGDLRVNLLEFIERGSAPDVVLIPGDHIGQHQLMNYSAIDPDLRSAKVASPLWDSATSDGNVYGVPIIQGNHLMLYYNKRYVEKAATNWHELFAQKNAFLSANQLSKAGDEADKESSASKVRFMAWSYEEMYWFIPFYNAFGGSTVSNGKVDFDIKAMQQALDFYKGLKQQSLPEADCDYNCAHQSFGEGKLLYTINGDWALKEYKAQLGDQLGVAVLPAISNQRPLIPYFSTHDLAFPNNSLNGEKRQDLIALIHYFQQPDIQLKIWQQLGVLPVETSTVAHVQQLEDATAQQMLAAMQHAIPMPTDKAMSIVWSAMRKGFIRHQMGVLNAEKSAQLMQQIADKQQH